MLCKARLEAGDTVDALFISDDTFVQAVKFEKGLRTAETILQRGLPSVREDVTVSVYHGPTEVGKSYGIKLQEPDLYILEPPNTFGGPIWWDGYKGEPAVHIEEYDGWLPWAQLLRILDRYPVRVPVRGSSMVLRATRIYISSNKSPELWHPKRDYGPLKRRIHFIWECTFEMFRLTQINGKPIG